MVSTRKKRQPNRRFLSQLSESDTDFITGPSNHETRTGSRGNAADGNISLNNASSPNQVSDPQVDMHTLEKDTISKVLSEVDIMMTAVETRVQDAVLTAKENLLIPRVEAAMMSIIASSGRWLGKP